MKIEKSGVFFEKIIEFIEFHSERPDLYSLFPILVKK